ncbi:hypothetical protein niasHT_018526 [Heterodera trifolii]|uniref:Uncharacterized protein n=1 Tax=Heterodera trifolii TaxID=157864 RepID=A0ABD2LB11_9BILA
MDGSDFIRSVFTVSASVSFVLGILFNTFMAWMIIKKTPAPMLIYSKILMAPCIIDIFLSLCAFIVQPIPVVSHGYFVVVQNGFFRNASGFYNYTANVLWFQMLILFVCCTTIQFVFRYYLLICDGQVPARLKYLTSLIIVCLLIAHVLLHYLSDFPYAKYNDQMRNLSSLITAEIGLTEIRFSSFTPARTYLWMFHSAVMLSIFFICYTIIVFFSIGTSNYIKKTYESAVIMSTNSTAFVKAADFRKNERMLKYNKEITMALIVQAILPTIDVIELSMQVVTPIFFANTDTIYYMVFAIIPLYFIPVLNPIAAILFIKPYRMAFLKIMRAQRQSVTTETS